ncbi:phage tail length tape measure family protein [Rhodoplanes sp. Z2-YC6860]|uniref:phage tail length tape measure family protein n=1 Tax=Rhodoplanes sp. Z2-YC6860 TaxID=674703 RepID=UPI00078D0793|nr:phage tail length tape measure family protein [Rhodoplanes sp. Z2-YC6860]AMN42068.1 hypothetical protein RHPLAN_36360 [Rhodoplanes sp. Z2-YC6860]
MTDTVDKIIIQSSTQGVTQSANEVHKLSDEMQGLTVSASNVEKSTTSVEGKFASLERRFSTTAGNAAQYEKIQTTVNRAVAQNPELQDRANAVMQAAAAKYGTAGAAAKALGDAHVGLSAQGQAALHSIRSVTEQITLGIPITQALTGQMSHLAYAASGQGGITGAFSEAASIFPRLVAGAASMVSPLTVTVATMVALTTATAAAALQYDKLQTSSQRALIGAGQRSGTTISDLNQFTSQNSGLSGSGLSSKEARELGEDFTRTGDIVISRLHGMSDAVVGFANQTGSSIEEARKAMVAFAVDPQKGMQELAKTYGEFDAATRRAVDTLVIAGDKTGAFNVITEALSDKSKAAAQNMGVLEKAYRSVVNLLATETVKPSGLEDQLAAAKGRLAAAQDNPFGDAKAAAEDVERLQAAMDKVNAARPVAELNKLSTEADAVDKAVISQIEQIEQLRAELAKLDRAKASGASSKYGAGVDDAARTAIENQIAALQEAQGQSERYNQRIQQIGVSWGDVGQSTAMALQAQQNQLPVIEAVGGAAKMAAQYAADYANAIDQGRTATEATALAASNLRAAQAQANSSAQSTLASLRDQYAVASASNVQEQIAAQGQATYNDLIRQGVDATTAQAVAAQQVANAQASVYQQMQKQVRASQDALDLAKASSDYDRARINSDIAYRKAMEGGATAAQAAQISVNTMMTDLINAQKAADGMSDALDQAAASGKIIGGNEGSYDPGSAYKAGSFDVAAGPRLGNGYSNASFAAFLAGQRAPSAQDLITNALTGGVNGAIATLTGTNFQGGITRGSTLLGVPYGTQFPGRGDIGSQSDIDNAVDSLFNLKLLQAGKSNSAKASIYQDQINYLQQQPQTIEVLTKIAQLTNSLNDLKDSTDALTDAEKASLNPLYSGKGALAVGYYKAANGFEGVAQGPPVGDKIPFHVMVNGGEHIKITPAGQKPAAPTSNDNSKTVTVNQTFNFSGSQSKNRRNRRQIDQGFGQTMASLS